MIKPISIVIPYRKTNDSISVWVQERQSLDDLNGLWEFPGGKVEAYETPEDAAIREVKEETSVQIKREKLQKFKNYTSQSGVLLMVFLYLDDGGDFSNQSHIELNQLLGQVESIPPANKEILLDLQRFFS